MLSARLVDARRPASFEVICAGEPIWRSLGLRGDRLVTHAATAGVLDIARILARKGVHVGLATSLEDDTPGRALVGELAALRIDVGGVTLSVSSADLFVVDSPREGDVEIPPGWSSQVLLLSGLSPVTSRAAALCRAARKARRNGTIVVLDVAGSLRQWAGHDPRMISMLIRAADVVRTSLIDLAMLGTDSASVRRSLRPDATLVVGDGEWTSAAGLFGEVRVKGRSSTPDDAGEECTAAICAELARPRIGGESLEERWYRVLRG